MVNMATYKVPQDVEADDKLLGPFSFRQFVYLIIVAAAIGIAWMLAQIFVGLVIIPMPIIIFFGALALPLKKDQPMETYLAAVFSFYFIKPRKRTWQPDGIESLVEITAPRQVEPERTKDITQHEASARLSYLTDIIDSRGWAVRGTGIPNQGIGQDPNDIPDMLDNSQAGSQRFDRLLEQSNSQKIQVLNQQIQQHNTTQMAQSDFNQPLGNQPIADILQQEASQLNTPMAPPPLATEPVAPNEPSSDNPSAPNFTIETAPVAALPVDTPGASSPLVPVEPPTPPAPLMPEFTIQTPNESAVQPEQPQGQTSEFYQTEPQVDNQNTEPFNTQTPDQVSQSQNEAITPIVLEPSFTEQSASNIPPSPAIIELANNSEGLTVADVARQAARIHGLDRGLPEDEVNISLHQK